MSSNNIVLSGNCSNTARMAVPIIYEISRPLAALALLVCVVSLLIIAGNNSHNLTHVGGGIKSGIVQNLWSTAKWSGIIASIGVGLLCTACCTGWFMVNSNHDRK